MTDTTREQTTEAKRCPFCGAQPQVIPADPEIDGDGWGGVRCVNEECPAKPDVRDYLAEPDTSEAHKAAAIRLWNMRAS